MMRWRGRLLDVTEKKRRMVIRLGKWKVAGRPALINRREEIVGSGCDWVVSSRCAIPLNESERSLSTNL